MSVLGMLNLLFWATFLWRLFGAFGGLFTRKEQASISVVIDALGLGINIVSLSQGFVLSLCFTPLWLYWLYRDYKRWKNTDDDDDDNDFKKRRSAWVKNKLPKPITKEIPQPI